MLLKRNEHSAVILQSVPPFPIPHCLERCLLTVLNCHLVQACHNSIGVNVANPTSPTTVKVADRQHLNRLNLFEQSNMGCYQGGSHFRVTQSTCTYVSNTRFFFFQSDQLEIFRLKAVTLQRCAGGGGGGGEENIYGNRDWKDSGLAADTTYRGQGISFPAVERVCKAVFLWSVLEFSALDIS